MSLMGPAVAFNHHEEPEFFQLELEQLRRTAMILEAELSQLEAQVRQWMDLNSPTAAN